MLVAQGKISPYNEKNRLKSVPAYANSQMNRHKISSTPSTILDDSPRAINQRPGGSKKRVWNDLGKYSFQYKSYAPLSILIFTDNICASACIF